uniref:Uncharacterized protein n=1 Tax=Oryza sativa subsp. japonica TaxID=39947 RepID=Q8H488_ORYSJ|nr:hypothetical protein [Oryza sativa Japonica Group]
MELAAISNTSSSLSNLICDICLPPPPFACFADVPPALCDQLHRSRCSLRGILGGWSLCSTSSASS